MMTRKYKLFKVIICYSIVLVFDNFNQEQVDSALFSLHNVEGKEIDWIKTSEQFTPMDPQNFEFTTRFGRAETLL
jgi:hypothetical protein